MCSGLGWRAVSEMDWRGGFSEIKPSSYVYASQCPLMLVVSAVRRAVPLLSILAESIFRDHRLLLNICELTEQVCFFRAGALSPAR